MLFATPVLQAHEIVVVAEDRFGYIEALNGRSFSFHAEWSGVESDYGLKVASGQELLDYLDIFFGKTALWYATLDTVDDRGRPVVLRTLIDARGAGSSALKQAVISTLKDQIDVNQGGASLAKALMLHMISSAYLDGMLSVDRNQGLWQIYPGHSPTSIAPPIISAALEGFKIFRTRAAANGYYGLRRHAAALKSSAARWNQQHDRVLFTNQMNSVNLTPGSRVEGKRVVVLDDFCTDGLSLDTARAAFLMLREQPLRYFLHLANTGRAMSVTRRFETD